MKANNKKIAEEQIIFIGIDFHKLTSTLCHKDREGKLLKKETIDTEKLLDHLSACKGYKIAIETTGGSNHMAMKLREQGHDVFLVNTNKAKAIGLNGQKTDDKDAEVLTDLMRTNFLPTVHLKSLVCREIKSILVQREYVVQTRVSTICHIRGIMREYGIVISAGVKNFYLESPKQIAKVENPLIRENLEKLFTMVTRLVSEEKRIEAALKSYVQENYPELYTQAMRLDEIPGMGLVTAFLMVAVIDNPERFEAPQKFGAYLGLIPGQFSSGENVRMGYITRSGCEMLRRYLIHGARAILKAAKRKKERSSIENWALRLEKKKKMNKASVALAHKLARVGLAIMRKRSEFVPNYKAARDQSEVLVKASKTAA